MFTIDNTNVFEKNFHKIRIRNFYRYQYFFTHISYIQIKPIFTQLKKLFDLNVTNVEGSEKDKNHLICQISILSFHLYKFLEKGVSVMISPDLYLKNKKISLYLK